MIGYRKIFDVSKEKPLCTTDDVVKNGGMNNNLNPGKNDD